MNDVIELEDSDKESKDCIGPKTRLDDLEKKNAVLEEELKMLKSQLGRREYPRQDVIIKVKCEVDGKSFPGGTYRAMVEVECIAQ